MTAFGGECRTETTQRQKITKTEKLLYLGVVAQGDSGLAVSPLCIDSTVQLVTAWPQTLVLASTTNRRDDVEGVSAGLSGP